MCSTLLNQGGSIKKLDIPMVPSEIPVVFKLKSRLKLVNLTFKAAKGFITGEKHTVECSLRITVNLQENWRNTIIMSCLIKSLIRLLEVMQCLGLGYLSKSLYILSSVSSKGSY